MVVYNEVCKINKRCRFVALYNRVLYWNSWRSK